MFRHCNAAKLETSIELEAVVGAALDLRSDQTVVCIDAMTTVKKSNRIMGKFILREVRKTSRVCKGELCKQRGASGYSAHASLSQI